MHTPCYWQDFASYIFPSFHYLRVASKGFDKSNPKPHTTAAYKWFCQQQVIAEPGRPSAAFPHIDDPDGRNRTPRNPYCITSVSVCLSFDRLSVTEDLGSNRPDMTLKEPYAMLPLKNMSHHNGRTLCLCLTHTPHTPQNHLLLQCDSTNLLLV